MTAQKLRIVLFIVMIAIVALAAGGFMYAKSGLDSYATTISQLNADAESGDSNIQTLRKLKTTLDEERTTIERARSVVASSSDYADKVISNISSIASQSGVTITSIEFTDNASAAGTASGAAQTAQGTTTAPAATGAPAGLTKKSVLVSIKTPLDYDTLMRFIGAIESNTLKMQLTGLTLTADSNGQVTTQALTIEVYVRS